MPSIFSLARPMTLFQIWFVVYLYVLPLLLYAAWAGLSIMDLSERTEHSGRVRWGALVMLVPLLGGACYLLGIAGTLRRPARFAIVVGGLIVWLLPLAVGVWLAGGPLGPKALS
jgi:hypothetical protein